MACACGAPSPCSCHEVTDDMRIASQALRRLDEVQRGMVLCWFCRWCHRYVGPRDRDPGCNGDEPCNREPQVGITE